MVTDASTKVPPGTFTHALTFDLEDWYHPGLVRDHVHGSPVSHAAQAAEPILALLDRHGVRATFFVLGEVALRCPDLIRTIHAQGHEIASHGVTHRTLWELTPDQFRQELADFRGIIDDILGPVPVVGFRAPTFSLDQRTAWAADVLRECGYLYDSSVFPIWNGFYGVPDAPLTPYGLGSERISRPSPGGLIEFPLTVLRMAGRNIPLAGGFYLRVLPRALLVRGLRRVARRRPFVIYLHPWESSASTPRVPLPLRDRLITYWGMRSALDKLAALLREFSFAPMIQVIRDHVQPRMSPSGHMSLDGPSPGGSKDS